MEEMTALRRARKGFGPRRAVPPAAMDERVAAEIRGARQQVTTAVPPRRGTLRGRAWWIVPAGVAATSVGLVLSGAVPFGTGGTAPRPAWVQQQQAGGDPSVTLDGHTILLAAATRARSRPESTPGKDSFVYTRLKNRFVTVTRDGQESWDESTYEFWLSPDGSRPGLDTDRKGASSDGGSDAQDDVGVRAVLPCPAPDLSTRVIGEDTPCLGPGYVSQMPTDKAGANEFLRRGQPWLNWHPSGDGSTGGPRGSDNDLAWNVYELFQGHQLAPRAWAAVFEVLADLPDATVAVDVPTASGRTGTAVVLTDLDQGPDGPKNPQADNTHQSLTFIFDPTTHELIGAGVTNTSDDPEMHKFQSTTVSIAEQAVVPTRGVRPDGSTVKAAVH